MTEPGEIYSHRWRQVIVVSVTGAFGVLASWGMVGYLSYYHGSLSASDDETLCVVASARPAEKQVAENFLMAHSADGTAFSSPSVRSGGTVSAAMRQGTLYCLFRDGSLAELMKESWRPVPARLDWPVLGIAVVKDRLKAFGQSEDRAKILTATLDNYAWHEEPGFDYRGDNIEFVQGVRSAGSDYLLWTEFRDRTQASREGEGASAKPSGPPAVASRLCIGRIAADGLEVLAPMPLERPCGIAPIGDENGVHVFLQEIRSGLIGVHLGGSTIRVVTFRDDRWGEPRDLELHSHWRSTEDFTVARFKDRTFVYTLEYWFGRLFAGVYGTELRGDEGSSKFLAFGPPPDDVRDGLAWLTLTVAASFIAAGGLAGFLRLKKFQRQTSPLGGRASYATVSDRAVAAGLDLTLVYVVMQLVTAQAGPTEFAVFFMTGLVVYGTTMEAFSQGQTLGKRLLGLRVLSLGGSPVDLGQALRRNLFKLPEMLTIGVGVALTSKRFQRPGDFLGGTVVVKELPAPVAPRD
jgi:uncharacterized RDD family membrane protein YckC